MVLENTYSEYQLCSQRTFQKRPPFCTFICAYDVEKSKYDPPVGTDPPSQLISAVWACDSKEFSAWVLGERMQMVGIIMKQEAVNYGHMQVTTAAGCNVHGGSLKLVSQ